VWAVSAGVEQSEDMKRFLWCVDFLVVRDGFRWIDFRTFAGTITLRPLQVISLRSRYILHRSRSSDVSRR
jgi:hypothetical protein